MFMDIGHPAPTLSEPSPETEAARTARLLQRMIAIGAEVACLAGERVVREAEAASAALPPPDAAGRRDRSERLFYRLFREVRLTVALSARIATGAPAPLRRSSFVRDRVAPAPETHPMRAEPAFAPERPMGAAEQPMSRTVPRVAWLADHRPEAAAEAGRPNRAERRRAARRGTGPPDG